MINGNLLVNGAIGAEKLSLPSFSLRKSTSAPDRFGPRLIDARTGPNRQPDDQRIFQPQHPVSSINSRSRFRAGSRWTFSGFVGSSVTLKDSASTYFYQLAHDGLGASLTANSSDRLRLERLGTLWNTPNGFRVGGTLYAAGARRDGDRKVPPACRNRLDGIRPCHVDRDQRNLVQVGRDRSQVKIDGTEFSSNLGAALTMS